MKKEYKTYKKFKTPSEVEAWVKENYKEVILEELEEAVQKEIKRHVVYGYIELEQQDWLSPISKEIILYHHERLNRSGYPFHMTADKIKPQVRLVAICDAFASSVSICISTLKSSLTLTCTSKNFVGFTLSTSTST